jgi:hypothetical protein
MPQDLDAVAPLASATRKENDDSPDEAGVPESMPESFASVSPDGTDPDATVHPYGGWPPLAAAVEL